MNFKTSENERAYARARHARLKDSEEYKEKNRLRVRAYATKNRETVLRKARERYARKKAEGTYVPQVLNAEQKKRHKIYLRGWEAKRRAAGMIRRRNSQKEREWRESDRGKIWLTIYESTQRMGRCLSGKHRRFENADFCAFLKERKRLALNAYLKRRKANDLEFAIRERLKASVATAIAQRGLRKCARTAALLGCSLPEFAAHIESLFLPGMTWENRHLWEIDHIRPLASFRLALPEEQRIAFHHSNMQPLWKVQNRKKSAWYNGVYYRNPAAFIQRASKNSTSLSTAAAW